MTRTIRNMTTAFALLVGCFVATAAQTQTVPPTAKQTGAPAAMEASIVKTIGAEARTVKVTAGSSIWLVARVNSNMNQGTHEGRNNEAKVIASLVAKEFGSDPKFGNVNTIRVQYSTRAPGAKRTIVDSIEFRKGPDGIFDFHQT